MVEMKQAAYIHLHVILLKRTGWLTQTYYMRGHRQDRAPEHEPGLADGFFSSGEAEKNDI